jgi:stringent starvation protein B
LPELSQLPYLLRAMLDWIVDNGWTPHLVVDARSDTVIVPRQFVNEGYIRLNISASATQSFHIGDGAVEFNARFGGVSHRIHVPLDHVLAIVARENGQGMAFTTDARAASAGGQVPESPAEVHDPDRDEQPPGTSSPVLPRQRPNLKLIK